MSRDTDKEKCQRKVNGCLLSGQLNVPVILLMLSIYIVCLLNLQANKEMQRI